MMDLHLYTNDNDFVIAVSAEDAATIMRGEVDGADPETFEFTIYPDSKPFTYHGDESVTKPASEWCRERGRGYFCTAN